MSTKRILALAVLSLGLASSSLLLAAADLPVVRQPSDPAYTTADRALLGTAATAITNVLRPGYSLSRMVQLGGLRWAEADFVTFAAGVLQASGYSVVLVTGSWSSGSTRTWILVQVLVSSGPAYIPVEAAPAMLGTDLLIGQVAWQGGASGAAYDSRYMAFAQAVAPAPNLPPTATVSVADAFVVVGLPATLMFTGRDPDGTLLIYEWTFADGTRVFDTRPVLWHTFREVGRTDVHLRVTDSRGAHADDSVAVDVLAEAPESCGCGGK